MAKVYVFPVRSQIVYMGVKAARNPYNQKPAWCALCPNPFGGNVGGQSHLETIKSETRQESHNKLNMDNAVLGDLIRLHECVINGDQATFYYAMKFNFNSSAQLAPGEEKKHEYQETTGEVLMLNLDEAPKPEAYETADLWINAVADWALQKCNPARRPLKKNVDEFKDSETVRALAMLIKRNKG